MQKWEYHFLIRYRGWRGGIPPKEAGDWDVDITKLLPALGDDGWELVGFSPRSDYFGDAAAGFSTSEIWVFKRPKP